MGKKQNSQNNQENAGSNSVVSIKDLSDNHENGILKTTIIKIEKDNVALGQTIDKLYQELDKKDQEIAHLQVLLRGGIPNLSVLPLKVTDEELIALTQLEILKKKAETRELTLEEVKKYDMLVKNKMLAQGKNPPIDADSEKLPTDKDSLLKIVSSKPKTESTF